MHEGSIDELRHGLEPAVGDANRSRGSVRGGTGGQVGKSAPMSRSGSPLGSPEGDRDEFGAFQRLRAAGHLECSSGWCRSELRAGPDPFRAQHIDADASPPVAVRNAVWRSTEEGNPRPSIARTNSATAPDTTRAFHQHIEVGGDARGAAPCSSACRSTI